MLRPILTILLSSILTPLLLKSVGCLRRYTIDDEDTNPKVKTEYQIRLSKFTSWFAWGGAILLLVMLVILVIVSIRFPSQSRSNQIAVILGASLTTILAACLILIPWKLKIEVYGDEIHIKKWIWKEYHLLFSDIEYESGECHVTIYHKGKKLCKITRDHNNMERFKKQLMKKSARVENVNKRKF